MTAKPNRAKLPDPALSMTVVEGILVVLLRMLVGKGTVTEAEAAETYWGEWDRCGWGKDRRAERLAG